jgi:curved DNA-binding protein CbpA
MSSMVLLRQEAALVAQIRALPPDVQDALPPDHKATLQQLLALRGQPTLARSRSDEATDYYAVLGVNEDATDTELKKAYRRLAHKVIPDRLSASEQGELAKLQHAYGVLSDPHKRGHFDRGRRGDVGGLQVETQVEKDAVHAGMPGREEVASGEVREVEAPPDALWQAARAAWAADHPPSSMVFLSAPFATSADAVPVHPQPEAAAAAATAAAETRRQRQRRQAAAAADAEKEVLFSVGEKRPHSASELAAARLRRRLVRAGNTEPEAAGPDVLAIAAAISDLDLQRWGSGAVVALNETAQKAGVPPGEGRAAVLDRHRGSSIVSLCVKQSGAGRNASQPSPGPAVHRGGGGGHRPRHAPLGLRRARRGGADGAGALGGAGQQEAGEAGRRGRRAASEEDAVSAQKLGKLQPFVAVFPQEYMGQLAPFGPT